MTTSVRHVDRGAWLSINGTRELGVGDLWRFAGIEFCDCDVTDFLIEGFAEIGVDSRNIEAQLTGQCIQCGSEGTTDWMRVGRIVYEVGQKFYRVDRNAVQLLSSTPSTGENLTTKRSP